ncbi:MAG: cyclase family protein [Clostridiales bacterium]|nr:cyclase family protein [Clostridiales bacterium]
MRIIDVSMQIHPGMQVYKNREANRPVHTVTRQIPHDSVNESRLELPLHTGTHIDSPLHMTAGGGTTETLPLSSLLTACRVLDLSGVRGGITRDDLLPHRIQAGEFVLMRTRNSDDEAFQADFIYLKKDGAEYLAETGVKGVGIDALGIERDQPGHETHLALMRKDILIIEGLALKGVEAGNYVMLALPLSIRDADGAPARVVLLDRWPGN